MEYISMQQFRVEEPYKYGEVLPDDCTKEAIGLGATPDEVSFNEDYRILD